MGLPQTPPGRGRGSAAVHWVYVSTPKGKKWGAHIAGPCHWFACHCKGRSKPCLTELTAGELTCERCSPFDVAQVIGYQPLYRESDGRPCQVIVHDYARESIDQLKLHSHVTVHRGEGATDTVELLPSLAQTKRYHSTIAERMRPGDLTETLLKIWGMPELVEWYRQTHGGGAPRPVAPPVAPRPAVKQVAAPPPTAPRPATAKENDLRTLLARSQIALAGAEQPDELAADAVGELVARLAKPHANGKPRPKG